MTIPPMALPGLVSRAKAGRVLGLGPDAVDELIRERRLEAVSIGKRVRVTTTSILQFLRIESSDLVNGLLTRMSA
jgi:hypothetical protein